MSRSRRSRIVSHPADPGVFGRQLLRFLRNHEREAWPVADAIRGAGLSEAVGWPAATRLLQLALIERTSRDTLIRIRVTARGRRYRVDQTPLRSADTRSPRWESAADPARTHGRGSLDRGSRGSA